MPRAHDAERQADPTAIDAPLIRALQHDGRASIHDLAMRLGVSRDAVAGRLRALTSGGRLRIVAGLNPAVAGHHILVHVRVDVSGAVKPVAERLAEMTDAVFVSRASGTLPLVFESRHADNAELNRMLDRVRELPHVRRLSVSTYTEVLRGFFVANMPEPIELDELDYELIGVLQRDGRASYRALADAVHLSPSSARARVRRLVDSGAIRVAAVMAGGIQRGRIAVGVGISTAGNTAGIRQHILNSPDFDFAARSHGSFDFITTVVGSSSQHVLGVLDELRELPGVSALDTWAHYDVVKEDYTRTLGKLVSPPLVAPLAGE